MKRNYFLVFLLVGLVGLSGCARMKGLEKTNQEQQATIDNLNKEIAKLNEELANMSKSGDELAKAKAELEKKLRGELSAGDLELALKDRGLVITILNKVLFTSGKADLKPSAQVTLEKVVGILNKNVPDKIVYVEGHTDNVPIRVSGWRSNWELSTARSTEVLHFLEDQGVNSSRLVACGYSEYHPVADNATLEGRQKNRRVEIIVSPKSLHELLPKSA
jgi:chemotaxis protein MotB